MNNPMDLTGKHIVVTGASSGLGRQTCITLSELGAKVDLIARNEERLNETLSQMSGEGHRIIPFDVCQIDSIETIVKDLVENGGKIDGFVHSAGIGDTRPLSMTKYDFLLNMMQIHLFSFVEFLRLIGKKKNSNDGASIVAVSSAGAIRADKGKVAYATTKGALDAAVRPLAVELGELRHIRVNSINPGWIKTDMYYDFIQYFGQERMDEMVASSALGVCETVEVSNLIAYLLSDATTTITGQNIAVDGGFSIHG